MASNFPRGMLWFFFNCQIIDNIGNKIRKKIKIAPLDDLKATGAQTQTLSVSVLKVRFAKQVALIPVVCWKISLGNYDAKGL